MELKTPRPFKQVYIFGGFINNHFIPALYLLLPNHETATYKVVYQFLKTNITKVPKKIVMDFERTVLQTVDVVYEGTIGISGCHFHFKNSLEKQIRKKGCLKLFNDSEPFKYAVRMLRSLVYCPPGFVTDLFTKVILQYINEQKLENCPEMKEFFKYFVNTYIGLTKRRGRHPPMFGLDTWSLYHEIVYDTPTTNNGL